MKDNTHFRNLRDSMVVSLKAFLKYSHNYPTHIISANKILPYYYIPSEHIVPNSLELKSIVPEHIVPNILGLQSGFRYTLSNGLPYISLYWGVLTLFNSNEY